MSAERSSTPGDRDWLKDLYERDHDVVFRYARSRVGREAALDVVADTFVEAARSRGAFDPARGSETAWLLGIATNRIGRWRREAARHRISAPPLSDAAGIEDPEILALPARVDAERGAREVERAMALLPDGERAAIHLHAVEGLDLKEVAQALRIGRSAAKLRVFRARRRLRDSLAHLDTKEMS